MMECISIKGQRAKQLTLAANTGIQTPPLQNGYYDVTCDQKCYIRVAKNFQSPGVLTAAPDRGQDVSVTDGYPIFAGNVVTVNVDNGNVIGVISATAGTFTYHMVGE